jgi:hypothetical protein
MSVHLALDMFIFTRAICLWKNDKVSGKIYKSVHKRLEDRLTIIQKRHRVCSLGVRSAVLMNQYTTLLCVE